MTDPAIALYKGFRAVGYTPHGALITTRECLAGRGSVRELRSAFADAQRAGIDLRSLVVDAVCDAMTPSESGYYTIEIGWSARPTQWHPTDRVGPFSVLTRGAFETQTEAHRWAQDNLDGSGYRVVHIDGVTIAQCYARVEED